MTVHTGVANMISLLEGSRFGGTANVIRFASKSVQIVDGGNKILVQKDAAIIVDVVGSVLIKHILVVLLPFRSLSPILCFPPTPFG